MGEMSMLDEALVRIFDSPGYQLLAVLAAFGIGAAHAVAPGHGKAVTAAYLVGSRGHYRHAAALGGVVALMHTFSAIVLAVAWVSVSAVASVGTPVITAALQTLAGALVVSVGIHLVRRRPRPARAHRHTHHATPAHTHRAHAAHGHGSEQVHADVHTHGPGEAHALGDAHGHDDAHARSHADQITAVGNPFTRRGLVALGLSGGLVPSPSSFVVLVSGLLTGQIVFALLLVAVFGLGMASTLTAVGVLTLRGTALVQRSGTSSAAAAAVSRWIPMVAAYAVVAGGFVYLTMGLRTLM